jgi:hypothetical protein
MKWKFCDGETSPNFFLRNLMAGVKNAIGHGAQPFNAGIKSESQKHAQPGAVLTSISMRPRSPCVRLMARTGKFGKTRDVLNKYDEDQ